MEAPVELDTCRLCVDSDGQRGNKQKLIPTGICTCPCFTDGTGVVADTARSMRVATHFHRFPCIWRRARNIM